MTICQKGGEIKIYSCNFYQNIVESIPISKIRLKGYDEKEYIFPKAKREDGRCESS